MFAPGNYARGESRSSFRISPCRFSRFKSSKLASEVGLQNVLRKWTEGCRTGSGRGRGKSQERFWRVEPQILEAVRELVSLAHTDAITNEADRLLIIGIESETDHLPIGEVRKLWAPDALQRKDPEIARAEALWKAEFLDVCTLLTPFAGLITMTFSTPTRGYTH